MVTSVVQRVSERNAILVVGAYIYKNASYINLPPPQKELLSCSSRNTKTPKTFTSTSHNCLTPQLVMPPTTIHSAPTLDSFTPLADHQSQTPEVFYGAKPVLHHHTTGARALVSRDQLSKLPIFSQTHGERASEAEEVQPEVLVAEVVDAYISSE